jgi:hypothetical protein
MRHARKMCRAGSQSSLRFWRRHWAVQLSGVLTILLVLASMNIRVLPVHPPSSCVEVSAATPRRLLVGPLSLSTQFGPNPVDFEIPVNRTVLALEDIYSFDPWLSSSYRLLLLRASGERPPPNGLNGMPVLFVHGNRGDFNQGATIASQALALDTVEAKLNGGSVPLDVFAADFRESSSAFHSGVMRAQASFINDCISRICSLYSESSECARRGGVVVIAHSMGGVASRLAMLLPNHPKGALQTLLTLNSPHQDHPYTADEGMATLYWRLNSAWSEAAVNELGGKINPLQRQVLSNVVVGSITGGVTDFTIRPELSSLAGLLQPIHTVTGMTEGLVGAWLRSTHDDIMWCGQSVSSTLRAVSALKWPRPESSSSFRGFVWDPSPERRAHTLRQFFAPSADQSITSLGAAWRLSRSHDKRSSPVRTGLWRPLPGNAGWRASWDAASTEASVRVPQSPERVCFRKQVSVRELTSNLPFETAASCSKRGTLSSHRVFPALRIVTDFVSGPRALEVSVSIRGQEKAVAAVISVDSRNASLWEQLPNNLVRTHVHRHKRGLGTSTFSFWQDLATIRGSGDKARSQATSSLQRQHDTPNAPLAPPGHEEDYGSTPATLQGQGDRIAKAGLFSAPPSETKEFRHFDEEGPALPITGSLWLLQVPWPSAPALVDALGHCPTNGSEMVSVDACLDIIPTNAEQDASLLSLLTIGEAAHDMEGWTLGPHARGIVLEGTSWVIVDDFHDQGQEQQQQLQPSSQSTLPVREALPARVQSVPPANGWLSSLLSVVDPAIVSREWILPRGRQLVTEVHIPVGLTPAVEYGITLKAVCPMVGDPAFGQTATGAPVVYPVVRYASAEHLAPWDVSSAADPDQRLVQASKDCVGCEPRVLPAEAGDASIDDSTVPPAVAERIWQASASLKGGETLSGMPPPRVTTHRLTTHTHGVIPWWGASTEQQHSSSIVRAPHHVRVPAVLYVLSDPSCDYHVTMFADLWSFPLRWLRLRSSWLITAFVTVMALILAAQNREWSVRRTAHKDALRDWLRRHRKATERFRSGLRRAHIAHSTATDTAVNQLAHTHFHALSSRSSRSSSADESRTPLDMDPSPVRQLPSTPWTKPRTMTVELFDSNPGGSAAEGPIPHLSLDGPTDSRALDRLSVPVTPQGGEELARMLTESVNLGSSALYKHIPRAVDIPMHPQAPHFPSLHHTVSQACRWVCVLIGAISFVVSVVGPQLVPPEPWLAVQRGSSEEDLAPGTSWIVAMPSEWLAPSFIELWSLHGFAYLVVCVCCVIMSIMTEGARLALALGWVLWALCSPLFVSSRLHRPHKASSRHSPTKAVRVTEALKRLPFFLTPEPPPSLLSSLVTEEEEEETASTRLDRTPRLIGQLPRHRSRAALASEPITDPVSRKLLNDFPSPRLPPGRQGFPPTRRRHVPDEPSVRRGVAATGDLYRKRKISEWNEPAILAELDRVDAGEVSARTLLHASPMIRSVNVATPRRTHRMDSEAVIAESRLDSNLGVRGWSLPPSHLSLWLKSRGAVRGMLLAAERMEAVQLRSSRQQGRARWLREWANTLEESCGRTWQRDGQVSLGVDEGRSVPTSDSLTSSDVFEQLSSWYDLAGQEWAFSLTVSVAATVFLEDSTLGGTVVSPDDHPLVSVSIPPMPPALALLAAGVSDHLSALPSDRVSNGTSSPKFQPPSSPPRSLRNHTGGGSSFSSNDAMAVRGASVPVFSIIGMLQQPGAKALASEPGVSTPAQIPSSHRLSGPPSIAVDTGLPWAIEQEEADQPQFEDVFADVIAKPAAFGEPPRPSTDQALAAWMTDSTETTIKPSKRSYRRRGDTHLLDIMLDDSGVPMQGSSDLGAFPSRNNESFLSSPDGEGQRRAGEQEFPASAMHTIFRSARNVSRSRDGVLPIVQAPFMPVNRPTTPLPVRGATLGRDEPESLGALVRQSSHASLATLARMFDPAWTDSPRHTSKGEAEPPPQTRQPDTDDSDTDDSEALRGESASRGSSTVLEELSLCASVCHVWCSRSLPSRMERCWRGLTLRSVMRRSVHAMFSKQLAMSAGWVVLLVWCLFQPWVAVPLVVAAVMLHVSIMGGTLSSTQAAVVAESDVPPRDEAERDVKLHTGIAPHPASPKVSWTAARTETLNLMRSQQTLLLVYAAVLLVKAMSVMYSFESIRNFRHPFHRDAVYAVPMIIHLLSSRSTLPTPIPFSSTALTVLAIISGLFVQRLVHRLTYALGAFAAFSLAAGAVQRVRIGLAASGLRREVLEGENQPVQPDEVSTRVDRQILLDSV